jgi:arogenate dehydrogenase (NADP+)
MNIGIVGLGLIGGCLGLDFKALDYRVYGVARRSLTCQQAQHRQIVDVADTDLAILKPCEVVFVCTPIATILPTVAALAKVLTPGAVITDVGSVKAALVAEATQIWPHFVGGHPMSGKSEAGLDAAEPGIFRQRPYVITPVITPALSRQSDTPALQLVEQLATELGSQLYRCSPEAHDRAVAWISHLPVMVSASLIEAVLQEPADEVLTLAQQLASSGFRDTSRVGGGNPELGLMMAQYNQQEVLRSLKHYQNTLATTIAQIEAQDWSGLAKKLEITRQARSQFVSE